MRGNIISYIEMCQEEGTSLQKGMNFRLRGGHSIILMSVSPNAPYKDEIQENGTVLIYEGHDAPKNQHKGNPKEVDQPEFRHTGSLTENGKFKRAAIDFKKGLKGPDIVKVYEKIKTGIWSDNGFFHLVDAWTQSDGLRNVFKFKLIAVDHVSDNKKSEESITEEFTRSRIIPTSVKLAVWKRDRGKCVTCGAQDELHFDHSLPYSKGGTSLKVENIQLLCARHNLEKSAKIQ